MFWNKNRNIVIHKKIILEYQHRKKAVTLKENHYLYFLLLFRQELLKSLLIMIKYVLRLKYVIPVSCIIKPFKVNVQRIKYAQILQRYRKRKRKLTF